MSGWIWLGQAGHFICSYDCRFHLHTHVGNYCVSTVGDWHPRGSEKADTVGVDRLFETMVFPLDDDGETKDWSGLDFRGYNDREAANAGHAEMCHRWAAENLREKGRGATGCSR